MKSWVSSQKYQEFYRKISVLYQSKSKDEIPESIQNWIAELHLLKDIPFSYLVPDENMLPMESIRFFYIDDSWIKAMIDGALSIGRSTSHDIALDQAIAPVFYQASLKALHQPRQSRMHINHRNLNRTNYQASGAVRTGFFLRTKDVDHWKGIEIQGWQDQNKLEIIRMEQMNKNLLFCLFDGEITNVLFIEPNEKLHFGTKDSERMLDVRRIDEEHVGELLGDEHRKQVLVEANSYGRINVVKLKSRLASQLQVSPEELNSTHLALELLSVPDSFDYTNKNNKSD